MLFSASGFTNCVKTKIKSGHSFWIVFYSMILCNFLTSTSQALTTRMYQIRMSLVEEGEVVIKQRATDLQASSVTFTVGSNSQVWGPELPDDLWSDETKTFTKARITLLQWEVNHCSKNPFLFCVLPTCHEHIWNIHVDLLGWSKSQTYSSLFWAGCFTTRCAPTGSMSQLQAPSIPQISHGCTCLCKEPAPISRLVLCCGACCCQRFCRLWKWGRRRAILPKLPARKDQLCHARSGNLFVSVHVPSQSAFQLTFVMTNWLHSLITGMGHTAPRKCPTWCWSCFTSKHPSRCKIYLFSGGL